MNTSAPGKLFLTGEYAVLEGAPALVMPVPQRAIVSSASSDRWIIRSDVEVALPMQEIPLAKAVEDELHRQGLPVSVPEDGLCLDTRAFFQSIDGEPTKLGVGGSAALTAALLKTLFPKPTEWADSEYVRLAVACHRRFQGGFGSGADIAVALMDDLIRYRTVAEPEVSSLPHGFVFGFVWTGQGAGTVSYLDRMLRFKESEPALYDELMHPLGRISMSMSRRGLGADEFIGGLAEMDICLKALSDGSRTGFYTDIHVELRDFVLRSGGIYKPSGAGGGDFGMVVVREVGELRALNEKLENAGYRTDLVSADRFIQESE